MSHRTAPPPVPEQVTTPNLRLMRGYEAAEVIARDHGVDVGVARQIVRAAYNEIERGSERVGYQCAGCGRLYLHGEVCPDHGRDTGTDFPPTPLTSTGNRLVVAYDKVGWTDAPVGGRP